MQDEIGNSCFVHLIKLVASEIDRLQSGDFTFIDLHQPKTKVEYRVKIPIKEFPQVCES